MRVVRGLRQNMCQAAKRKRVATYAARQAQRSGLKAEKKRQVSPSRHSKSRSVARSMHPATKSANVFCGRFELEGRLLVIGSPAGDATAKKSAVSNNEPASEERAGNP